jgi:hypothetical protein
MSRCLHIMLKKDVKCAIRDGDSKSPHSRSEDLQINVDCAVAFKDFMRHRMFLAEPISSFPNASQQM